MIFSVLFLTAWFLLAAGADAHAGFLIPIFTAIGAAITSLGVIGQFLVGIAIKVGLGLLQKALTKKQENKEPGIQGDITVGGDNPLSFIMGAFATAGQLEYVNTWGTADKTPNAYITHVISLSDLPLHALTGLWVGDKRVTLPSMSGSPPTSQGWPVADFNSGGADYLWIKFHDGSQTAADTFLTSTFGGDADRPWQSDQIGRGVAYVVVTARVNSKLFSGVPSYFFETDGVPLYDIRKDTTAGGSGAHRWNTPSTWEPSDNPIVHVYNLARGVFFGSEWICGGQTTEGYQLPASNWMTAMNACDEDIDLASGGVQKRYRSGCQITSDQEPADVIESLLKGCSGRMAEVGGSYKVAVGAPGLPVYSFTDASIVISEGQSFDPFPGLEQTFNGAQASYPEPAEKWASKDAPAYLRTDLEVLDDNRRLVTGLTFPTVPYAVQVQRLLKEAIEDSRRFRQHQFYLPPEAWLLEPGDIVSWTSARNSYDEKKFIIISIEGGSNFLQLVTLKEVDPSDFSWDPLTDEHAYSVGFLGPIRPPAQLMTGWQVFPAALTDANGNNRRPSIGVRYDGDLDDVQFVRVKVRLDAGDVLQFDGTLPYGDPATNSNPAEVILNGTFLPNTNYEVQGDLVPYSGRATTPSAWLPVKTDDIRFGADDIYLPGMVEEIEQNVKEGLSFIGEDARALLDRLISNTLLTVEQDGQNVLDKQELRESITATANGLSATYDLKIDVLVTQTEAISQRVETLEASLDDEIAARSSAISALSATVAIVDGKTEANADALTLLDTTVGNFSASGRLRVGVTATETGAQSTIALSTSATSGGATSQAALLISALSNGKSMVGLVADQVYFTDNAGNKAYPFVFSGGVARMNVANIGTVTAGVIQSPDGKFIITVASGKLEWFD